MNFVNRIKIEYFHRMDNLEQFDIFLYTEWPEQGVPKAGEGFIDFIGQVHKTKEGFGQDGPIVVHCSAGKSIKNIPRISSIE